MKESRPDKTLDASLTPAVLVRAGLADLPRLIMAAGPAVSRRFLEFFTATIRNKNTRLAYARTVGQSLAWCEPRRLALGAIEPIHVAAYIESHPGAKPTVKQHLAAIRMCFDWLVTGQVLPGNPAHAVRGPKYVVRRGKTPVLPARDAPALLDAIDTTTFVGLRDRALLGVMCYTFARVSAVVALRVEDYYFEGKRGWLRLHEKGGRRHEVPCHHNLVAWLDAYLQAVELEADPKGPLFPTATRRGALTGRPLSRTDVFRMIKRRATAQGLPASTRCHTFRATGITAYLLNGGTIEGAQKIAAHASPRTTKFYDRRGDAITLDEVERIGI